MISRQSVRMKTILGDKVSLYRTVYLCFGIWAVHLLHLLRFRLVDWSHISALPDWRITLGASFWMGLLLIPLVFGASWVLSKHPTLPLLIVCFMITEAATQVVGRSLLKLVTDMGVWSTVVGNYAVLSLYGRSTVEKTGPHALATLHSEVLGILRTTANICMFVIGTLGIGVASNWISRYFGEGLGQGTSWAYVIGVLYLAFGMFFFLALPLFQTLREVRERINQRG